MTAPMSAVTLALLLAVGAAQAQTTAQGTVAADPKGQLSDVDRAKRDADKVFQWIKFHAEKGEARKAAEKQHEAKAEPPKPAAKATPAPAPAAPAVAKRQELDPAAERALAERAQAERAPAAAPAQALTPPGGTQVVQTSAPPPAVSTQAAAQVPPPQVVAMAAPATTAPAGRPAAAVPAPTPATESEEDTPLKLVHKVDPEYPRSWLVQQRNGSVLVNFRVKPDGTVEAVEALRSPDRKVSAAAVAAVKQWRFEPIARPKQVSVEIGFQVE